MTVEQVVGEELRETQTHSEDISSQGHVSTMNPTGFELGFNQGSRGEEPDCV
jgi:hypothetical protein